MDKWHSSLIIRPPDYVFFYFTDGSLKGLIIYRQEVDNFDFGKTKNMRKSIAFVTILQKIERARRFDQINDFPQIDRLILT